MSMARRVQPAERYMDDISSPDYRQHLVRFADELTRHYAHNPALAAIGYNNEIGNGVMSYSEADRQRFIEWLKTKIRNDREPEQGMGDAALVAALEFV